MKRGFVNIALSAALLVLCGCTRSVSNAPTTLAAVGTARAVETDAGLWLIEYYIDGGVLSYAVLNGPSPHGVEGRVRAGRDSGGQPYAKLHRPDGTEVSILGSGRVFQILGTNVLESSQPISAQVFESFLKDHHQDYSLAAILKSSKEFK